VSTGACYKPAVRRIGRPIVIAGILVAGVAHADHTSLNVSAAGDVAVTDNLFSVSRDANPESDVYTTLRPGLIGTWETPRMIQNLAVEAEILEYATHNNTDPSVTLRGRWDSLWLIGPRSEFGIGGDAAEGHGTELSELRRSERGDRHAVGQLVAAQRRRLSAPVVAVDARDPHE
jgi:hypothetical protein